ncbi:DODA-type extradiol aromatic ring-opening family dioxygenase [Cellvibrio japonicus]|uniref:Catalytic LigB subunit of aromatic ring-opening dioxygenase n=1 Tax=Cellvibrio japonicus (strain Ueda107) TaxID=498211 RepID=B3PLE7_CELJU|nr:class III extradiol ring-cleavage dioxygenase [Cellvibrio japonicus]ACE85523.1 Catalytic LigB subunit of aromatic ring-opening dioxygenase [Cellvibrio japonicus Ueda107]QEI11597.1 dioxygenase [Cellvibrio japonicus]QEI15171.1 dioxygenase [Cellvibrio japonicus]QEI18751.1 dioxygenase [Cellvibrio japonicus]
MAQVMPVVFVPHGGGPMPLLGDANHHSLAAFLRNLSHSLPEPQAILVITAHWEAPLASISSAAAPGMLYDYYGFPAESYEFHYPAPGSPALAQQVLDLLRLQGIAAQLDAERDYDHGTFVPLMLAYPAAQIPVVQLSLVHSLEPALHIAIGKALAPLREQGVLILGSGMSFHNMRAFFSGDPAVTPKSLAFHQWLSGTMGETDVAVTEQQLVHWQAGPQARFSHPREEHLLPLLVCFGAASAAGQPAQQVYEGLFFNTWIAGYRWG